MTARPILALAAALVVLAAALTATVAGAPPAKRGTKKVPAPAAVRTLVDGVAADWDAGRRLVTLDAVDVTAGPRALRRAVRRGADVSLRIARTTRLTAVDEDGARAHITAPELFDALDLAADEVDVEASGRVAKAVRPVAGEIVIPASRVVVHLPPAVEDDTSDPAYDEGDGTGDDPPAADDPGDGDVDDPGEGS